MTGAALLRVKKLTGNGILIKAARHNRREIHAELGASGAIDATKMHLNMTLMGPPTAEEVGQLAKTKLTHAGISKTRKNAVLGVELVFSLPSNHQTDVVAYFTSCANWAGAQFGGIGNILSVDVHLDEAQDHAHVLLIPLINGRLQGSDAVGNKRRLTELQIGFFNEVASQFGFSKPRSRLSGNSKAQAIRQVLEKLRNDPATRSSAWAVIRDSIERDPLPYALSLGIEIKNSSPTVRSMSQIFTSKGKGRRLETHIGFQPQIPYRGSVDPERQTLGLCMVSPSDQLAPCPQNLSEADQAVTDSPRRERDCDANPAHWNSDLGEFVPPEPHPPAAGKLAANRWVQASLANRYRHSS